MAESSKYLRKTPTQDRSRRRVEAIVLAAANLFAEQGFEATTVEAIAEQAGTSVGSVYQFFGNKLDIFCSISQRCNDRVRVAVQALVAASRTELALAALIDQVVDGIFAVLAADVGFRAVWKNTQLFGVIAEDDLDFERELVAVTEDVLRERAAHLDSDRRATAAQLLVQTVSAGLFLIFRPELEERVPALIAELKTMLRAYAAEIEGQV
ncbi:MAG: TetR/AcrR family transcriptional regulator [Deltaproteobacteria bacterium]|nr:TetR/AcrR family transcriptional regulator [Deltaproteobacteria bacterium]